MLKQLINFLKNNKLIIIVLSVILLVVFYFNPNFGLGMRQLLEPLENSHATYYGPDGGHATISTDSSGNVTIIIVDSSGNRTVYTRGSSDTIYVGQNGGSAEILNNGTIVVTYPDGRTVVYNNNNTNGNSINHDNTNNYDNYNHYSGEFENVTFYGPDGGTAQVVRTPDENTVVITYKNGVTEIYYIDGNNSSSETYTGPNGNTAKVTTDGSGKRALEITLTDGTKIYYYSGNRYENPNNINNYDRYEPYGGASATQYTGPAGNTATQYTGPAGNTATTIDQDNPYYDSLPEGIYGWQIPKGEEDKYILKSQVVPPVCPKCPDVQCNTSFDDSKCPPCPACERCPEPSFSCEKVPNYSAFNSKTMPLPVLSDFSNFGM